MSNINILLAENPNFKLVKVKFNPSEERTYTYRTFLDLSAEDMVVVNANNQLKVVQVVEVLDPNEVDWSLINFEIKWVVDVVDFTQYRQCIDCTNKIQSTLTKAAGTKLRSEYLATLEAQIGTEAIAEVKGLVRL